MDKGHSALFILSCAASLIAQDFRINNKASDGFVQEKEQWRFEKTVSLTHQEKVPEEFLLSPGGFKVHKKYGHIRGFNGEITLKLNAPGEIETFTAECSITNFADSRKREVFIRYSLNGTDWKDLAEKAFSGGTLKLDGTIKLPENHGCVYVRFGKKIEANDNNGKYGFVLFQNLKLIVTGKSVFPKAEKQTSKSLKKVFPTGVFWPWERTKPCAEYAKMDLWQFIEQTMYQLKENGYDTCWFVNHPDDERQARILSLAEKYGLKVLFNTDLLSIYYHGASSLDDMERLAFRTAVRIGDSPALLGYILKDEPLLCDIETCNYLYSAMKKADPDRDSVAVVMNRQSMSYLRESKLPVICSDIYYFGADKSTQVPSPRDVSQKEFTNALKSYGETAELYGKHTWFMGQMFSSIWGRHWLKNGKIIVEPGCYLHWRAPTEAESRWQVWEALRLGTKGIFFYVLFPPIPLEIPPSEVTDPLQLKRVQSMDNLAKEAASWKNQPLVEKTMEIDPCEGMLLADGSPTPQMLATAPVTKIIRANEALLTERVKADFPVFFPGDVQTDTETFVSGDRWIGVIVNRDLDHERTTEILLPLNVTAIKNLADGKLLTVSSKNSAFQKISISLPSGGGMLLEAMFKKRPGMRFCIEKFDQNRFHRLTVNKNAEIFHYGNFGADANRALRLKNDGDPTQPVCVLLNLTNPKTAQRTFALNLNKSRHSGTVYCQIHGRLHSAKIKAVRSGIEGEQANIAHLKNISSAEVEKMEGNIICEKDFFLPCEVPIGTSALEFYLSDSKDYIDDVTVWFVPD